MGLNLARMVAGILLAGSAAVCSFALAQGTQQGTHQDTQTPPAPKSGGLISPPEQKDSAQIKTGRSFETSAQRIPAEVPRAVRVDPDK